MTDPTPSRWWRRSETVATLLVVVLAAAGVIALWPASQPTRPPDTSAAAQLAPDTAETSTPPDDRALTPARRQAALQPCPAASPDTPPARGPLAGITTPCLGSPGRAELAAGLAGRPALLNVWASWCQPCREEIPVLAAYTTRPDAIPVVGVNVLDRPAAALELLTQSGAHYPSAVDSDRTLRAALRWPRVLPTSYLLRPDGTVTLIREPAVFRSADQIAQAIARAAAP